MVLLAMFIFAGVSGAAATRLAGPLLMLLATTPLALAIVGVATFNQKAGLEDFMFSILSTVSGSHPYEFYPSDRDFAACGTLSSFLAFLVTAILIIVFAIIGLASVIALPLGILAAIIGSFVTLFTRQAERLRVGMFWLAGALGLIIATGVIMRIVNVLVNNFAC